MTPVAAYVASADRIVSSQEPGDAKSLGTRHFASPSPSSLTAPTRAWGHETLPAHPHLA